MQADYETLRKLVTRDLAETLLRVVLIVLLVLVCVRVFTPFSHLVIVAMILAVALYPLYVRVVRWFGGRRGWSATALVLSALLLLGTPIAMLGVAVTGELSDVYHGVDANEIGLKAPDPKVAEWPIVGPRVYATWSAAATNLPRLLQQNREVVKQYAKKILAMAASALAGAALFVLAIVVAGILMVYADEEKRVAERILTRLTNREQGPELLELSIATIRSVATGVVGVAVIQAILLGVGFLLAGIPGAAVLAFAVMFLGILQLPAVIVSIPAIAYLWMADDSSSTVAKVLFTVWFVVGGLADNVLKPLLLGRGVEAPMLVILVGAIGGMVAGGMTGLFMGAVLLAVGYQIFMQWVDRGPPASADPPG
ncbi:AI-2E family transporter [Lysobacter sp. KIS68-7]|uniref:AI-2E family transporter n=1 Tax=Lysobacter sp. KIS68-7 TaxID=2904252 RepID=UPI001E392F89|nr:AI-2E family transporter [Lysobacter sp. KIS68-7]UHQ19545.1 AI-2E family transporter [Lysobacter sp. KIS68-7]